MRYAAVALLCLSMISVVGTGLFSSWSFAELGLVGSFLLMVAVSPVYARMKRSGIADEGYRLLATFLVHGAALLGGLGAFALLLFQHLSHIDLGSIPMIAIRLLAAFVLLLLAAFRAASLSTQHGE